MGHNITVLKTGLKNELITPKKHSYWIWSFYHSWNIVYKFGPFLAQFWLYNATSIVKFPNVGKMTKDQIFPLKKYTWFQVSIVIWLWYIALKLLWRIWESDVNKGAPFPTFFQIFYKKFKILVLNCNLSHFVSIFKKIHEKLAHLSRCQSLLFLCYKKWHKKFAPILIVCQRWRQSQKTQTGITFDLDVILTSGVFLKVIFFEGVSVEKIKLHTFSGVQYHFKNCSSDICGWRFSLHFLKILGFLRFIFL